VISKGILKNCLRVGKIWGSITLPRVLQVIDRLGMPHWVLPC